MFVKTTEFLILRPIKYCVTSIIHKLLKHDADAKAQYNLNIFSLANYFHIPDHQLWQAIPSESCTLEARCKQNRKL